MRNIKKLVILLIIITFLSLETLLFFVLKNNYSINKKDVSSDKITLQQKQKLEEVLNKYYKIKSNLKSDLEGKNIKKSDKVSFTDFINFKVPKVFAKEQNLIDEEIIAKGLATFLEIGREKTVSNAKQINNQDIENIKLAQSSLKKIKNNLKNLKKDFKNNQQTKNLLDNLFQQYDDIDLLLNRLLEYKQFYGLIISKFEIKQDIVLKNKFLDILSKMILADNEDVLKSEIKEFNKTSLEMADVFDKEIESFKKTKIPLTIRNKGILKKKIELTIKSLSSNKKCINKLNEELSQVKNTKILLENMISVKNNDECREYNFSIAKLQQNLVEYKKISGMDDVYKRIINNDNIIRKQAQLLQKKYKLSFVNGNNMYLNDLMGQFYRKSSKDIFTEKMDKLLKKMIIKSGKNKLVTVMKKDFSIEKRVKALWAEMICSNSCDNVFLKLETPKGKILDEVKVTKKDSMDYRHSRTYKIFYIKNPQIGHWKFRAEKNTLSEIESEQKLKLHIDLTNY
jgi:hypothetical protein